MNAYFGSLKIYEVIEYDSGVEIPESLKEFLGHFAMVRFGSENGTPFIVRTEDVEIRD